MHKHIFTYAYSNKKRWQNLRVDLNQGPLLNQILFNHYTTMAIETVDNLGKKEIGIVTAKSNCGLSKSCLSVL